MAIASATYPICHCLLATINPCGVVWVLVSLVVVPPCQPPVPFACCLLTSTEDQVGQQMFKIAHINAPEHLVLLVSPEHIHVEYCICMHIF